MILASEALLGRGVVGDQPFDLTGFDEQTSHGFCGLAAPDRLEAGKFGQPTIDLRAADCRERVRHPSAVLRQFSPFAVDHRVDQGSRSWRMRTFRPDSVMYHSDGRGGRRGKFAHVVSRSAVLAVR